MAVFLSTTYLHVTYTSASWVYPRIAFHSKRLHAAPYFYQEIWQCFSLQLTFTSPPSQVCLEFTFALLFTANSFKLRHYWLRDMAVFLFTTYFHVNSTTSLCWAYLRIAFPSIRHHAAPNLCKKIWQCFSLQLTFTSPTQVCLEFTLALIFTASAFKLRLIDAKWYGSVSLYNIPSHDLHH